MKNYILFLMFLISLSSYSQFTLIPDQNFEQALINLGLDDVIDGQVLTANISGIEELDIPGLNIQDLTGIQDFTLLSILSLEYNLLTNLDISQNINLEILAIDDNPLISIDISNNLNLFTFSANYTNLTSIDTSMNIDLEMLQVEYCNISSLDLSNNINLGLLVASGNQLTELDLSNNILLEEIYLYENQLTEINLENLPNLLDLFIDDNLLVELDLSNNPLIEELICSYNPNLIYINLKNGNNSIIDTFEAIVIGSNACIQVDDAAAATAGTAFPYNLWEVDPTAIFSEDCSLSTSDFTGLQIQAFPNPTSGLLNVKTSEVLTYSIYGIDGSLIKKSQALLNNTISLENFKSGVYFIQFQSESQGMETIKIIKK